MGYELMMNGTVKIGQKAPDFEKECNNKKRKDKITYILKE